MKSISHQMSFLYRKTFAAKNAPANAVEDFHVVKPFVPRPKVVHSDDEDTVTSLPRVPSDNSMPDLVSENYQSESESDEHIKDMIVLVKPNQETLDNLRNGLYDITYKNEDHYVGEIVDGQPHGQGKYTFLSDEQYADVQEGRFEEGSLVEGVFHTESFEMIGTFENNHGGIECLEGGNCRINWCTGISYQGAVEMDEPYADGQYTIPEGTTIEFEGQVGILTHVEDRFYLTFESGPIWRVSSEDFDCIDMKFPDDSTIRIVFRDNCVFEGVVFENDDDEANFTIGNRDVNSWNHFQSILWLMSEAGNYPIKFFDEVQERQLTLRQLMKFEKVHWKMVGLDRIQGLQLVDSIQQISSVEA